MFQVVAPEPVAAPEPVVELPPPEPEVEVETEVLPTPLDGTPQAALFDLPEEEPEEEAPRKFIYVHFETRADMEAFSKVIGQKVTMDTDTIHFPEIKVSDLK